MEHAHDMMKFEDSPLMITSRDNTPLIPPVGVRTIYNLALNKPCFYKPCFIKVLNASLQ